MSTHNRRKSDERSQSKDRKKSADKMNSIYQTLQANLQSHSFAIGYNTAKTQPDEDLKPIQKSQSISHGLLLKAKDALNAMNTSSMKALLSNL